MGGRRITCQGDAIGWTYTSNGGGGKQSTDKCVDYKKNCESEITTLRSQVPTCRDSCFATCRANHVMKPQGWVYGAFAYGQTPPPAIAHNILRVTDGEGRIVVDNEYGVDPPTA